VYAGRGGEVERRGWRGEEGEEGEGSGEVRGRREFVFCPRKKKRKTGHVALHTSGNAFPPETLKFLPHGLILQPGS